MSDLTHTYGRNRSDYKAESKCRNADVNLGNVHRTKMKRNVQ